MWIVGLGCSAPAHRPSLDEVAEGYVRGALMLARHQPSLVENWRGNAAWRPETRVPVATVRTSIAALLRAIPTIDQEDLPDDQMSRVRYLRRQLQALDLAAERLLGEKRSFAEEVLAAYHVPLRPPDADRLRAARETLERLLPGDGPLSMRHAAFRRSMVVPPARAAAVLQAALEACRTETRAHITLPADEAIDLRLGVVSPWDGFARYQGGHRSVIEIGDSPLDVSRALHLACHEAYPGHHTQLTLLDDRTAAGDLPELRLEPAFGPHLLIAEGAAEVGADLAFPPDARRRLYRDVLLPRAGLPPERADHLVQVEAAIGALETAIPEILARYLDSRLTYAAAAEALATEAAVMEPETLLDFAERQRTRAVAYVLGRDAVGAWVHAAPGREWERLAALFSTRPFAIE